MARNLEMRLLSMSRDPPRASRTSAAAKQSEEKDVLEGARMATNELIAADVVAVPIR